MGEVGNINFGSCCDERHSLNRCFYLFGLPSVVSFQGYGRMAFCCGKIPEEVGGLTIFVEGRKVRPSKENIAEFAHIIHVLIHQPSLICWDFLWG